MCRDETIRHRSWRQDRINVMASFYIKTDLAVVGPFTGIEIREATMAGIIRPNSYLGHQSDGPWVAAAGAGLFDEKGNALPHPAGTQVPTYQTRGMPGAFMGPFKLRELIGLACQGMLPPGTELQSDPDRPWIPITGTGILPACLRGDLVKIDKTGKRVLRTVVPRDLEEHQARLDASLSPIQRAGQVQVKGATASPLAEVSKRVSLKDSGEVSGDASQTTAGEQSGPPRDRRTEAFHYGAMPVPKRHDASADQNGGEEKVGVFTKSRELGTRYRKWCEETVGHKVRPRVLVAMVALLVCLIGLPVGYTAYKRMPMSRHRILGQWIANVDVDSDASLDGVVGPAMGVSFDESGKCVLMNTVGSSWTGDYTWLNRSDLRNNFRPLDEFEIRYDTPESHHRTAVVEDSDGYIELGGFVKAPPLLDGHPVRGLFVRRDGDRLSIGYPVKAHWANGRRVLSAAWVDAMSFQRLRDAPAGRSSNAKPDDASTVPAVVNDQRSFAAGDEIREHLRSLQDEKPREGDSIGGAVSISRAVQRAESGGDFEFTVGSGSVGRRVAWQASFAHSQLVDAAYLLRRFGVPITAEPVREFEKPRVTGGELFDGASWLRYDGIDFVADRDGRIVFLRLREPGLPNLSGGIAGAGSAP
ncbi:hypothetical protein RSSM_01576 [Rhodopirellula sallentina SM41]|uniref:Uncharacterized protein n=2 Tax=Rhodopirellula TaxID=265488 RepID=M5U682_9BACT|nr:hypothetical protein RSSM_01576 [Rhodopirellula sallentina SM41]